MFENNSGSNNSFISHFFVLNLNFSDCSLHSTTNKFFLQYVSPALWQHHHTRWGAKKTAARDVIVSQKKFKDSPQIKFFDGRLLNDEELHIVHQAPSLPLHLQCKISWLVDCASIFIVNHRRASWMLVRQESKCGDLHTDSIVGEDPVLSVMWMILRWRIKNLLLFLVWWFKLFLVPGIHERERGRSVDWK